MISPWNLNKFSKLANASKVKYQVLIEDVQKLIDRDIPMSRDAGFGWKRYNTLDEIYSWLDDLQKQHPQKVEVIEGGQTYEGRIIKGVKLTLGEPEKPGVFIEGGIHAREWIAPATVTYLINEFLTSKDPEVRKLAEAYEWHMFPSVNPDGYVYSFEGVSNLVHFFFLYLSIKFFNY